jgi:hypothetical protein
MKEQETTAYLGELRESGCFRTALIRAAFELWRAKHPSLTHQEIVDAICEAFGFSQAYRYELYRSTRQHGVKVFH